MRNKKKTIFLTIGNGIIARNLLQNKFFKRLKEKYKIIIFSPLYNDDEFCSLFGGPDIEFEELIRRHVTRLEQIFISLHKALIYNDSVKIKSFYSISSTMIEKRTYTKILKNYAELIVFGFFLSKVPVLRSALKWIDRAIFNDEYYENVFEKHNPDLAFLTSISAEEEVYLLRSTIRRGIPNVGMTKSWDNFSKVGFREWVDKLIVWSDYMKDEVMEFQRYKEKDIIVIGIPQFDILHDIKNTHKRNDFINTYNLDPNKKTILFGQSNPPLCPDDPYICEVIKNWIISTGSKYQLLIRPHFMYKDAHKPYMYLVDNKTVFIDLINKRSKFEGIGAWDLSEESQIRRAISLRFSDCVVNSASSLVLDTICSDTHFISYVFDKDKTLPYGNSVKRIFDLLWYVDLRENGFDKLMAHSEEQLTNKLDFILSTDKKVLPKEYEKLISRFCYKADGQTGERLFSFIDNYINESDK